MSNILIFSHVQLWEPHHAEALELAYELMDKNYVYILSCTGDLGVCPANPKHEESLCSKCRKQTKYSSSKILNKENIINYDLKLDIVKIIYPKFAFLSDLRRYEIEGFPIGSLVCSQLVDKYSDCYLNINDYQEEIHTYLDLGIALFNASKDFISQNRIDKVYVWNGRRICDGPVIYAAKFLNRAYETFISGADRSSYLTLPAVYVQDLNAHKERIRERYLEYPISLDFKKSEVFFNSQRYGDGNYPGFVQFSKDFKSTTSFSNNLGDNQKKNVVIFTSSFWEFYSLFEYTNGLYKDHYDGLLKILNNEELKKSCKFTVRWHPNLRNSGAGEKAKMLDVIKETENWVYHITPDSSENSYLLCDTSNVVISFGSTIGVEAAYYGKPSILVGRSLYEDLGCCYLPKTEADLIKMLQTDLQPLDKRGAEIFGDYYMTMGNNKFNHVSYADGSYYISDTPVNSNHVALRVRRYIRKFLSILGLRA